MVSLLRKLLYFPIPIWVLLPVALLAAIPTFYGNLNIPTGGTITDSNVVAASCVQTNSSGKYVYATCPPTPYPTPTPFSCPTPTTTFACLANTQTFAGSNTFSQTIASSVSAGSADFLTAINGVSSTTGLFTSGSTAVSGVTGQSLAVAQNGGNNLFALDNSGDIGLLGSVNAGLNSYNFYGRGGNGALLTLGSSISYNTAGNTLLQFTTTGTNFGCFGTAQSCPISFYTNGVGSSVASSINSSGTYTVGSTTLAATAEALNGNLTVNGASGEVVFNGTGSGFIQASNGLLDLVGVSSSYNTIDNEYTGSPTGIVAFEKQGSLKSYIDPNGTYTAGSSSYGASSATINGPLLLIGNSGCASTQSCFYVDISGGNADLIADVASGKSFFWQVAGSNVASISSSTLNGNSTINLAGFTTSFGCSSGSGVPCTFSWACTVGGSGCTSPTQAVPAGSKCTVTPTSDIGYSWTVGYTVSGGGGGVATGTDYGVYDIWVTLASTTLTIHVTASGNSGVTPNNSSLTGNGVCL